jgi:competence protein ComGC
MVNWAAAETCKRCGAHFNLANETLYAQAAYASPYQTAAHQSVAYQSSPYAYAHYPQMKKNAGLAVASLVVGIISFLTLSFVGIGAITGIVLGIAALSKIKKNPAQYGGQGMAIAGLITSVLSIMIAVPLAIIMAIAIPNMLASRMAANEASAISLLRIIHSGEATYQATSGDGEFGTLRELVADKLIDSTLAGGTKKGYRFTVRVKPALTPNEPASYEAVATPVSYRRSGRRSFYIDETGVIRVTDSGGAEANADDPLLGEDWDTKTYSRSQSSQDDF